MSFKIVKTTDFNDIPFQNLPQEILSEQFFEDFPVQGSILSDLRHVWQAKGPCLEIRDVLTGRKVGSWVFGGILKDSNTKIISVSEVRKMQGRVSILIVALECSISGGLLCFFDIFGSKVLRVIQVGEQITSLHVIDSLNENSLILASSPLQYFDGIIAIGTVGGNVFLLDMCQQICENAMIHVDSASVRDELNPCQISFLKKEKFNNIKKYVDLSVKREEHLAIHLNEVINSSTQHFTLQGEKGEDRVHVNRSEAQVSSIFHSSQIASLLVGYNFGAFQLWDLTTLNLIYTSPICDDHIPVTYFTVQEPADDPKAYCYIWVTYSHNIIHHSGLPFAVMYSFYYDTKTYVENYGYLYENFQHCSIRFQLELGDTGSFKSPVKGGTCIGLQSLSKSPINKDLSSLSLCLISWLVWNSNEEINTCILLFDLNQWYKEQMPRMPNSTECSNYIVKQYLNGQFLDIKLNKSSLDQFIGVQRLDEHFCPTSLSFDLCCLNENSTVKVHNKGLQRAFIDNIEKGQHLSLIKAEDYYEQVINLGLVPLFCEIHLGNSLDIEYQREILLNLALEQNLIGWLCDCTSRFANNAFNASGFTIFKIINWAFQRALTLKNSCENYCIALFDFSGGRLDNNTIAWISSSINQIKNICSLYNYISNNLLHFVLDKDTLFEEQHSLENVIVYFEVLLWMVNIGLLPEYSHKNSKDRLWNAPYLVHDLTEYYNKKRAQFQLISHETFIEKDCLLFIDNLINQEGGAEIFRQQWQEDGGTGLYPPPSLQSVLRIYLLNGPNIIFKHSLVTYILLDVAMTIEENKIIKLLLNFPQIFDLSQSHTKIVQAFWHLDHDDYETALESILDPCILIEDIHHWHHSVIIRSLLLQKQFNLALAYLQIRKPSIQDEKDLFTVISLLVSKNMLDEAFKFRQYQCVNNQGLLLHIFNECNKNETLHSLLYRCLNTDDERAFFRYLQNTKTPRCEDLKVFYFLLRSRFLEALDTYSMFKRPKPENQGLLGQRNALTADNLVKMFNTLLPDVNRDLVEMVRKERSNLWKETRKPVPLSVFVHNINSQVQYKSSVIFAALAKAKQTFNDTLNDTKVMNDVTTEETPFLRTPTVFKKTSKIQTPLLKAKVIDQNELGEEYSPPPCKILKLSPRASTCSSMKSKHLSLSSVQSKLNTPVIRRRKISIEGSGSVSTFLPQSILKGSSRTILDDSILDQNRSVNMVTQLECENSIRRFKLGLSPRKPISHTPVKSHVKFDDQKYLSSSTEQNTTNESISEIVTDDKSKKVSINNTASTVEETFYSPDNSFENNSDRHKLSTEIIDEGLQKKSSTLLKQKLDFNESLMQKNIPNTNNENMNIPSSEVISYSNKLIFQSPKSRKSYKRSFAESPVPVRSSPRSAKKPLKDERKKEASDDALSKDNFVMLESESKSPSVTRQKLKGRRSLSRTILEKNTFSQFKSTSVLEEGTVLFEDTYVSSSNTTLNDSESNFDGNSDVDNSLDEFLQKFAHTTAHSFSTDKSNSSLSGERESNEIFSKDKMSCQIGDSHRESLKVSSRSSINDTSKQGRREYHSKTVRDSKLENSLHISKTTQNENNIKESNNVANPVEEISDVLHQEEINIYEDLSSGSEDVKQLLRCKEGKNKASESSFSANESFDKSNRILEMPINVVHSAESNENTSESAQSRKSVGSDVPLENLYFDNIPMFEQAFVSLEDDIIELSSSSEDSVHNENVELSEGNSIQSSDESSNTGSVEVYVKDNQDKSSEDSCVQNQNLEIKCQSKYEEGLENIAKRVSKVVEDDQDQAQSSKNKKSDIPLTKVDGKETDSTIQVQESILDNEKQMDSVSEITLSQLSSSKEEQHRVDQTSKCDNLEPQVSDDQIHKNESSLIENQPSAETELPIQVEAINIKNESIDDAVLKTIKGQSKSLRYTSRNDKNNDVILNEDASEEKKRGHQTDNMETQNEGDDKVFKVVTMQSKSLQCTLAMDETDDYPIFKDESSLEDNGPSKEIETENEVVINNPKNESTDNKGLEIIEKQSKSLQCTLDVDSKFLENDEVRSENGNTPLVLRTVKKTYPTKGKKKIDSLSSSNLDATPKLTVNLIRTYSKKHSASENKVVDDKLEPNENLNIETSEVTIKSNIESDINREKISDFTQETGVPKDHKETLNLTSSNLSSVNTEDSINTPDKISVPVPQKEGSIIKSQLSVRLTRSMTQQERSSSSVSEKSIIEVNNTDNSKKEQDNSSTTTTSQTSSSKLITEGNTKQSDDMFDLTFDAGLENSQTVELDIMEKTLFEQTTVKSSVDYQHNEMKAKKRARSASVSQMPMPKSKKRTTRSKTIDQIKDENIELKIILTPLDDVPGSSSGKELQSQEGTKHRSKASSDVGAYTTSRRLTRRQASMLKSIGTTEKSIRFPIIEDIDPIHLLDKQDFEGSPDPEECKLYEASSPSESAASVATSRQTRSASVVSDTHAPSTPKKLTKTKNKSADLVSDIKSRLRRSSVDTVSVTSEQSDSPGPSKKVRRKEADEGQVGKKIPSRRQSRASSVSSVKSSGSEKTDVSVRTRSRRLYSSICDLPEIQEEKSSDGGNSSSSKTEKGRKKLQDV